MMRSTISASLLLFALLIPILAMAQKAAPLRSWKSIDGLIADQQLEAAAQATEARLNAGRAAGNEAEWTRALLQLARLRIGLHGYETGVRLLREETWPKGELSRVALNLSYAHALTTYSDAYSWEIRGREQVQSAAGPVDLKAWTFQQIQEEARRAFGEAWKARERVGSQPTAALGSVIIPNDFPPGIRDTLRDSITYLAVEALSDSSDWRPEEENALYRLELKKLLSGNRDSFGKVVPEDSSIHPMVRVVAMLADLEAWHQAAGRREAALEAYLERIQLLNQVFTADESKSEIRSALAARLEGIKDKAWWARGMALLARFEAERGALVRAHGLAKAGHQAYPSSVGGKQCLHRLKSLEAPEVILTSMYTDNARRRSVEVTHRNISELHFRAYSVDIDSLIRNADDRGLLPSEREARTLLKSGKPVASWKVSLPPTPDFELHRTYVTPPLERSGLYVIVASVRPDFRFEGNRIQGVNLLVTRLALVSRMSPNGERHVTVVDGESGKPVQGAEVDLYRANWKGPHQREATRPTSGAGEVRFTRPDNRDSNAYFLLARKGADVVLDANFSSFYRERANVERKGVLVFTDRSIYRPLQKLSWKVVAYAGKSESARFEASAGQELEVQLMDPNGEAVVKRKVRTNTFGSAAGEFEIPTGRLLGTWSVQVARLGGASVRVEEYKRPTFEVSLKDPDQALRINRAATLQGEARYHFGLPVTEGTVRWRVTREPEYPWWWRSWGMPTPEASAEVVATGSSPLNEQGSFQLQFNPEADERELATEGMTFRYAVEAQVTDSGGETREASRSFRLGKVAIEGKLDTEWGFLRAGVSAPVSVVRSDLDGTPRSGKGSWRLSALVAPTAPVLPADVPEVVPPERPETGQPTVVTDGDRLRPRWSRELPLERALSEWKEGQERGRGELQHDAQGRAKVVLPALSAGAYRLHYETVDAFGGRFQTRRDFLVAGDGKAPVGLAALLEVERPTVRVGEPLRILVGSGFADLPLQLETSRGGRVVERRWLETGAGARVIEVPIREEDRGGLSVSVTAVKDHQLLRSERSVFVPWDDRELKVEFSTFRDRLKPGQKETWQITVKGADGKPLGAGAAEVLGYMYDRALDLFAPHSPPSALNLYPRRMESLEIHSTLQQSYAWVSYDAGVHEVPNDVELQPDSLRDEDVSAIGGPGRRGGGGRGSATLGGAMMRSANGMVAADGASMAEAQSAAPLLTRAKSASADESAAKPKGQEAPLRQNFAETAFWIPQLVTGKSGEARFEFTVPDSVTSWNVWVHALTRDLKGGSALRTSQSLKELMVRPYVPRFVREGDKASLEVVINNASTSPMSGTLKLELQDAATQENLLGAFGLSPANATQPFTAAPGKSVRLSYALTTPRGLRTVTLKAVATSGGFSDGELRPFPILPSRMHLAQSRFTTLRGGQTRTLTFADLARDDDPTRVSEKMVVTLDTQLFYGALEALPYLVNYPYECTEQTLNRFVSTGILSRLFTQYPSVAKVAEQLSARDTRLETWDAVDPNQRMLLEESPWLEAARGGSAGEQGMAKVLDPKIAEAERAASLAKLQKSQTSSGGFPWFPGGPPSPYMTLYLLHGMARAAEYGVDVPDEMTHRAWSYVSRHFREEYAQKMRKADCCWEFLTFLNYVASSLPSKTENEEWLKEDERKAILEFSFKHWRKHSPYLKGYLALTLHRMGRGQDALRVFDSVMDSAKTTEELGTFWAPEDRGWLWYNDTIETHAFALRTLMELRPKDPRRDGMVQWLLLNKKLNHWKSTRATSEVLYALVKYLEKEGALGVRESLSVRVNDRVSQFVFEPDRYTGKKNQLVVPAAEIDPKKTSSVTVTKEGKGFAFASATWHFSTEQLPTEERGDLFSVSRRYFRRDRSGKDVKLVPLSEGAKLSPGDEVEVQLSLRSKHAAEYVHLRDPRAAGLEPENAESRHRWDLGISWYEETRDSGSNFFFEQLPAGEYTFKYRLRANMAGTFRVGPATVQSLYAPEFNAYSTGANLLVGP